MQARELFGWNGRVFLNFLTCSIVPVPYATKLPETLVSLAYESTNVSKVPVSPTCPRVAYLISNVSIRKAIKILGND